MPRPGFYNDNEYRCYPFICGSGAADTQLPDSAVLDAGLIMSLDSGFDPASHSVWLSSISRANSVVTFVFATDAPGAVNTPIYFDRDEDESEWATSIGQAAFPPEVEPACSPAPLWEGFLVTGPLSALLAILAPGQTITYPANKHTLEPARIQSLMRGFVRSINVANTPRELALPPEECRESSSAVEEDLVVNARCLTGDVRLKEGYNCRIRQVDGANEIRIAAEKNAGDTNTAELCEHGGELPLYTGEPFDETTGFYSGGPACNQMISTLNGVGGARVTLYGGAGVRVTADASTHTITVALAPNTVLSNCNK